MSPDVPPVGFEPHDRRSPLTAPWEPIYCNVYRSVQPVVC